MECDETAVPLFHSRQLDDGQESCVTLARGQFTHSKVVCSQTLVSRCSSENSLFRAGCLTLPGVERWESHECNKLGQLRTDCSVCKKRIAKKGNKPKGERVETTAVMQGVMSKRNDMLENDFVSCLS